MKKVTALDSSALLAYFGGEKGCETVTSLLRQVSEEGGELLLSVVHWGEILYIVENRHGREKGVAIESLMDQMHLEIVDVDREQARQAASLKTTFRLPYADCFAASLALVRKATLMTADNDFRVLKNIVPISWI